MSVSLRFKNEIPKLQPLFDQLQQAGDQPRTLLKQIANMGENQTRERFSTETGPDGQKWLPSQRAEKRGGKTLTGPGGHLGNSITSDADDNQANWGTNRVYAAIHQLGGTIDIPARSQNAYFKQDTRSGEVGNRFVKKAKSNFAQRVTIGPYQIEMPARPYLGVSEENSGDILELVGDYLRALIQRAAPGGA